MPNTRNIDMLISYYANTEITVGQWWNSEVCFGAVLDMFNGGSGSCPEISTVKRELDITEHQAGQLFYLENGPWGNVIKGWWAFQSCLDPAGYIIGILETLRDTGEVIIPSA